MGQGELGWGGEFGGLHAGVCVGTSMGARQLASVGPGSCAPTPSVPILWGWGRATSPSWCHAVVVEDVWVCLYSEEGGLFYLQAE